MALWPALATAQGPDEKPPLEIIIRAPLIETQWQEAPSGVTLIGDEDIEDGRALLQPTEALNLAPGVLVQNRNNFAQNPRVSIRGFGARAPFGIRGVRVRLDGIPLTTVDGQAQVDAIDPSSIQAIEVLRGANAVLHGNSSGGLLDYRSYPAGLPPLAQAEAASTARSAKHMISSRFAEPSPSSNSRDTASKALSNGAMLGCGSIISRLIATGLPFSTTLTIHWPKTPAH